MEYKKAAEVRVGPSSNGLGVFSLKSFALNALIGPIRGRIVEDPDYESDYCMEFGANMSLEPAPPFRYLNHSCHPNCALVELEVEYADGQLGDPELWLETKAEIVPGDEMTIDYSWPATDATACHCGCPDCRGWIVAVGELDRVDRDSGGKS